jgi:hypothetical protein
MRLIAGHSVQQLMFELQKLTRVADRCAKNTLIRRPPSYPGQKFPRLPKWKTLRTEQGLGVTALLPGGEVTRGRMSGCHRFQIAPLTCPLGILAPRTGEKNRSLSTPRVPPINGTVETAAGRIDVGFPRSSSYIPERRLLAQIKTPILCSNPSSRLASRQ